MTTRYFVKTSSVLPVLVLILGLAGCGDMNHFTSDAPRTLDEFEAALRGASGGIEA
jgi:hypothetical protein